MDKSIKVFAPATVANVGPGYDVFGLALSHVGDVVELQLTEKEGIDIRMPDSILPTDPTKNVAGVAAQALLNNLGINKGLTLTIYKKVESGSGLGSSASSAAGAVYALNEALGKPFSPKELVSFAMQGEKAASGVAHADNVAPSLIGGFTLIRSYDPLDVVELAYPENLIVVVVHPQIEVKTADSKKILKREITLSQAVKQWGNIAGLVSGMASSDYPLISRSLKDDIVEPTRSMLIPGFSRLKSEALDKGALGCSISGSGPSVFALCNSDKIASEVARAFNKIYTDMEIECQVHISPINPKGCEVID